MLRQTTSMIAPTAGVAVSGKANIVRIASLALPDTANTPTRPNPISRIGSTKAATTKKTNSWSGMFPGPPPPAHCAPIVHTYELISQRLAEHPLLVLGVLLPERHSKFIGSRRRPLPRRSH